MSGKVAAAVVVGATSVGIYYAQKHFTKEQVDDACNKVKEVSTQAYEKTSEAATQAYEVTSEYAARAAFELAAGFNQLKAFVCEQTVAAVDAEVPPQAEQPTEPEQLP